MDQTLRLFTSALFAILAASLGACSAVSHNYDPDEKFASFVPTQSVQLTGSRIPVQIDPNDSSRPVPTLAPMSILTREYIDQTGETSLRGLLIRTVPNMVTSPGNR